MSRRADFLPLKKIILFVFFKKKEHFYSPLVQRTDHGGRRDRCAAFFLLSPSFVFARGGLFFFFSRFGDFSSWACARRISSGGQQKNTAHALRRLRFVANFWQDFFFSSSLFFFRSERRWMRSRNAYQRTNEKDLKKKRENAKKKVFLMILGNGRREKKGQRGKKSSLPTPSP